MTILQAPAKINLFLAIRGKDVSGYHEIETVLACVPELADEIQIEPAEKLHIEFHPNEGIDPNQNTLTKAIEVLQALTGRKFHYKISVHKKIPPCSGLGGGASDAASVLLHLNEVEGLGLSNTELQTLGAKVGMDVPFFVSGHALALGTHYGEKVHPLPKLPADFQVKIEPASTFKKKSTEGAYALWDKAPSEPAPSLKAFLAHLQNGYAPGLLATLHSDFENLFPEAGPFGLASNGLTTRHLCGSGSASYKVKLGLAPSRG